MSIITAYKKEKDKITRITQDDWQKEYGDKVIDKWKYFRNKIQKEGEKYEDAIYSKENRKDIEIYFGENLSVEKVEKIAKINKRKENITMAKDKEYTKEEIFNMVSEYNDIKERLETLKKQKETYKKAIMSKCVDGEILESKDKNKKFAIAIVNSENETQPYTSVLVEEI